MSDYPYDPYQQGPANKNSSGLTLAFAFVLIAGAVFAAVLMLSGGRDDGSVSLSIEEPPAALSVREVSRQTYPASLAQEISHPSGGGWLLPAAAVPVGESIYVLDTGRDRILELDGAGRIIAVLDSSVDERLVLRQPMALATDGRHLFVANSLAAEILVLDSSGRVQRTLTLEPPSRGAAPPRPIGLALAADGGMVVSDAANHIVLLLDAQGAAVKTIGTGSRAAGSDGFNVPAAVALDGAGNIYVVDTLNGRVVKLSPDGAFIRQFGELGETAGTFSRPKGVAVDSAGRVYVSDGLLAAVQVFSPEGDYLGVIGRRDPGDAGAETMFVAPAGLWIEGDRLYVTDRLAGLIVMRLGSLVAEAAGSD